MDDASRLRAFRPHGREIPRKRTCSTRWSLPDRRKEPCNRAAAHSIFLSVTGLPPNLRRQADPDDPCLDEAPTLDGPTSDNTAGIGVEFESSGVVFKAGSPTCNSTQTNQAKGKQVGNRFGNNWQLTADTTDETEGRLTAEYILNGQIIKIGTGTASAAAAAVSSDIIAWNPYMDMPNNQFNVDGNTCNPWAIIQPEKGNLPGNLVWAMQITAPLPFEAINDLFEKTLVPPVTSPLLAGFRPSENIVSVNQEFFQSTPNGISPNSVKADALGFLSLVMSYAKAAKPVTPIVWSTRSPKILISIMPRTDFVTLYAQVQSTLPLGSGTLYDLVKVLACYKNYESDVDFDSKFCGGTAAAPEPNSYMDGVGWCLKNTDNGESSCLTVQAWVTSITSGSSPDELTKLDRLIDSSIGGLGAKLENIIFTTRAVPLFEFRNLGGYAAGSFEKKVNDAEQALITYHLNNKSPPQRKMAKRQTDNDSCPTTSAPSSITPTPTPTPSCTLQNEDPDQGIFTQGCICGSTTLPLLTVTSATNPAQSCAYTALPTTTEANPISIPTSIYTSACQVCTLIGGIADTPTCATITGCQNPSPPAATSTTPPPPPPPPPPAPSPSPVCNAGFHGTDNTCGGKCNGPKAKCGCVEAGYEIFNLVCTCTC